jgi:hypothetical protein
VDGRQVKVRRSESGGVISLKVRVPAGRSKVRLTIVRPVDVPAGAVTVLGWSMAGGREDEKVDIRRWTAGGDGAWESVNALPVTALVYFSPFARDSKVAGAASLTYVSDVLDQLAPLIRDRTLEGMVAYRPDLNASSRPADAESDEARAKVSLLARVYGELV